MNYFEEINSAAAEYFPASIFMIRYDSSATAVWRYNDDFSSVRQTLPHWHREQEIVYVENGELQFTVNGRHLPVCTGDILLINGFDIHAACGEGLVRVTQYVMPLFGNSQKTIALSFNLGDAQARRLNIRIRGEDGKTYLAHTLNNTCVAPPRMLIAFLENHLQADGSVTIPKCLQPYMGGKEVLIPKH